MASDSSAPADSCADVAVVILNWNGQQLLRQFLPAVLAHSDGARIIVADNASTDDSVAMLRREFPGVEIVQNPENLGFCAGYNMALGHVEAKYYMLLNSDVEVTPGWLRPLRGLLEQRPQVAACQPKIRQQSSDAAQRQLFEYAGGGGGYLDRLGYPFCRGRLFDTLEKDSGQYDDPRPVAWATGACLFVRAETWQRLGGLETAFFAHMEEIDLCWRLWNAGQEVWYHGSSVVYHVGGGTLHKSNPRKTYLNFRNGLALVYKNVAASELIGIVTTRLLLDWVAALRFLSQGATDDAKAIVRAHRDVFSNRRYWQQQRRLATRQLLTHQRPGVYAGSLVWAYFGKKIRFFSQLTPTNFPADQ
ncbi:glycosyltransferase family 2 protein [Hymenobacter elongatus]|uniref:Glycosyltransferase family 2 protein n=1 Tax=Hymenobacter elongatus TaxID=877208 RepID=A0A4Z0PR72_9BACT|nr:glycosyltransferase family 2 protein [Hymenobacter elongatus]TGE20227.1 glycosyltransferase family 2 protein [Hymenobacter elongatus]